MNEVFDLKHYFRKYVDTSVSFPESTNDIHVVIAENGAGKTTFLNAMTWCLYNKEPKIKDQDDALPTLNTEVIFQAKCEKNMPYQQLYHDHYHLS